jgi:hypothetical protein
MTFLKCPSLWTFQSKAMVFLADLKGKNPRDYSRYSVSFAEGQPYFQRYESRIGWEETILHDTVNAIDVFGFVHYPPGTSI